MATICELSKQEELAELQKHCDQEIQSLQEALRGVRAVAVFVYPNDQILHCKTMECTSPPFDPYADIWTFGIEY